MPSIRISVPHNLQPEEAVRRLKNVVRDLQARFADKIDKVEQSWNGNSATFRFDVMGFSISGTLQVSPDSAQLEGDIPMAALLFKSKIETVIREKMTELLT